jgi:hypothetical protein
MFIHASDVTWHGISRGCEEANAYTQRMRQLKGAE